MPLRSRLASCWQPGAATACEGSGPDWEDALRGLLEGFANGGGVPSAEAAANVGSDTMP